MNSFTNRQFREAFKKLPASVRQQARSAYKLFRQNPAHPSLHFKRVSPTEPIYSVRVGLNYRALGVRDENTVVWFWIGSHSDYDKLLSKM